ncbi:MAG: arsenate reductase [Saprospiraceae bacterium]|nr:arsenate reductase [Saprospiraceae bacterium]
MNKIYYLGTCSTCQRIMQQLDLDKFELQDIKTEQLTEDQLQEMRALSDSYESLFSRRAMKYRSMGLQDQDLEEQDYKRLILEEYTFLKRPVILYDGRLYVGSSKKNIAELMSALS